jgi:hypothetical protein
MNLERALCIACCTETLISEGIRWRTDSIPELPHWTSIRRDHPEPQALIGSQVMPVRDRGGTCARIVLFDHEPTALLGVVRERPRCEVRDPVKAICGSRMSRFS